jgi:hypothetical protein
MATISPKPTIFSKIRLRPSQLWTVADRRYEDAAYLQKSGQNRHANGAMYLGGFVVECLSKAELMDKHSWLQSAAHQSEGWTRERHRLWALCYRLHDLDELLANLPSIEQRLRAADQQTGARLSVQPREVCGQWTICARYSPQMTTMEEAVRFLGKIKEIKKWLE